MIIPRFSTLDITQLISATRVMSGSILIPMFIMEATFGQEYGLPQHPIDTNSYASDTVWREPKHVSINAFVTHLAFAILEMHLDSTTSIDGFTIYLLSSIHRNMYLQSMNIVENNEVVNGYNVQLEFDEIQKVKPKQLSLSVLSNFTDAPTESPGSQTPTPASTTMLKDIVNEASGLIKKVF